jgi:hypothetical protein
VRGAVPALGLLRLVMAHTALQSGSTANGASDIRVMPLTGSKPRFSAPNGSQLGPLTGNAGRTHRITEVVPTKNEGR